MRFREFEVVEFSGQISRVVEEVQWIPGASLTEFSRPKKPFGGGDHWPQKPLFF